MGNEQWEARYLGLIRVPSNVRFEVDDVEAEWTYHKPFDYIHCRFLGGAIRDWPRLVRQCYEYVMDFRATVSLRPSSPVACC